MTTRRNFLRNSVLGAAAVVASTPAANRAMAATAAVNRGAFKPLRISMLSYSFHGLVKAGMMDIFHFFETCKYRYGLDAADLWTGMFTGTEDDFIDKVYSALEDRQLVVPNIAVDGAHIMHAGGDDPKELRARQDRYMQIGKRLGVGFIRFDAGPYMLNGRKEEDGWTNEEFDFIVKRYKELAQVAYDYGFKVGAENHWGPEAYWSHTEKLIKAVDHPGFAICMHFGGWRGTPAENIAAEKAAAKYVAHTHIPWDTCEDPNLPKRLSVLREAGYEGYYSVEQHSAQNEYNLVEAQLGRVTAVLTSWNRGRDGELYPPRSEDPNKQVPW
ncbi:MAG: sugar phosphate isomerase/epimerase [Tannerellaceae bacterium]|jgi:sugar phosphate isomerase/epimerase|nr:sugar phosphate isomerase/epimerase [Tannerellaceae bacterium]